ncbi:unnamed protein product [Lampetra planeri]
MDKKEKLAKVTPREKGHQAIMGPPDKAKYHPQTMGPRQHAQPNVHIDIKEEDNVYEEVTLKDGPGSGTYEMDTSLYEQPDVCPDRAGGHQSVAFVAQPGMGCHVITQTTMLPATQPGTGVAAPVALPQTPRSAVGAEASHAWRQGKELTSPGKVKFAELMVPRQRARPNVYTSTEEESKLYEEVD